ncbi:MAG: putative transporter [Alphaproteobacteria bacterium]|nr:putative transporter [Alphaproteobacteria bacterium]
MSATVIAMLCICLTASIGMAFGEIKIKGISIGICGVLFAGLFAGFFLDKYGITLSSDTLAFLKEFGLIMFIYSTGLMIGPNIFTSLKRDGMTMNLISVVVVFLGFLLTVILGKLFVHDIFNTVGLYAGAINSTPALGSGLQFLTENHYSEEQLSKTSTAYAITYPFAILSGIGVFIFLKQFYHINIADEVAQFELRKTKDSPEMAGLTVIVNNPNFNGIQIRHLLKMINYSMAISRMKRGDEYIVPNEGTTLQTGDVLLLFGPKTMFQTVSILFEVDKEHDLMKESADAIQSQSLRVSKTRCVGKPLSKIMGGDRRHWVISRVIRNRISYSPTPDFKLAYADEVIAVGKSLDILPLVRYLGNDTAAIKVVRFIPYFIGMILGLFIGMIPFNVPGVSATIRLGSSGGPLLIALLLSYRGSLGRMVFYTPLEVLGAFKEFGLILFLAIVGLASGAHFFELICSLAGLKLIILGICITSIPMLVVGMFMRSIKKMNYMSLCGTLAGCISSLPTVTFLTNMATTDAPAIGYATVFPLTLLLRVFTVQIVALLMIG